MHVNSKYFFVYFFGGLERVLATSLLMSFILYFLKDVCAGILEQSMGAKNRIGIGFSYRPARLHRREKSFPWNRFLGSFKF
jgi:hypothetical protein